MSKLNSLKNKSFKIHELLAFEKNGEVSCLWEGEEPTWDDKIDYFLEMCNNNVISNSIIEIKGGANLNFSYGSGYMIIASAITHSSYPSFSWAFWPMRMVKPSMVNSFILV